MARLGKREKWALNAGMERVLQPNLTVPGDDFYEHRGSWGGGVFGNSNPIVLDLGCGKGAFSVFLAQRYPARNFIGIDLKGHRFWSGADEAERLGLGNVVFVRAGIQEVERLFAPQEVQEIWLPFSDPQPKDGRGNKRITSGKFVERYRRISGPGAILHIKTDSALVFELALEELGPEFTFQTDDVHSDWMQSIPDSLAELLAFQTHYEARWIREGRNIHYLQLAL